ncbi:acetoacetate decarboxylase family protein [Phenylobacterium montanum]|uniref:Acetoacetate decarboxylase family protein n=1 Tax=Phenylobacterium montanum TaxID=2823693 RepID=A0A975IWT0_9CAUL|nr:acetoacetate decarboxylase family protein [Caulobacter sp. S6]QUD90213.1 acetoacetate decarboxylase family protein [Caulobacter sp. S6]
MTFVFKSGARYRMPVVFGPAPGPRQHPEGRMWTREEAGTMSAEWMKVAYRTDAAKLGALLPPGFSLRGDPIVSVSCAWFKNLYWLAGRGYGILAVDFPVTYQGKTERHDGAFCPVLWEGQPEAITTGREELGFSKLYADFTEIVRDKERGSAACQASWFGHTFFEIELNEMVEEVAPDRKLPGSGGGAQLYYKYMPSTSPGGCDGADLAYVTTAAPLPGTAVRAQNINFDEFEFRKWNAKGSLRWTRATFEQMPLSFHVVNGMSDLPILEFVDAEMVAFSGPGIGISMNGMRAIEPA